MMLCLLIYTYATGRFGSRTIEAATPSDVAVRYLCANTHPDHDSICSFRAANKAAFRAACGSVLPLAHQLQLTRVGTVSVEGTKLAANASQPAAVSCQRAGAMIAQWELEVKGLMERAAQAEARENKEPLDIPAALARREKRVAALKQARAVMARNGRVNWRRRSSPNTKPNKPRGQRRAPPSEDPAPSAQYNFTAPESGLMKAGHGQPFAQAAVDGAMPIVGERVSVAANDQQELAANSPKARGAK